MKYNAILFVALLFSFLQTNLAQPGFNKVTTTDYPQGQLFDMIVHNDTVIGYGLAFNDSVEWTQGLLLVKFDSSGNLLNSNLILAPEGDFYSIHYHWGKITTAPGGGYTMTAAPYYSNSSVLIKVNNDLEVEFTKEFPDTVNLSNFRYVIENTQDGYLLYGAIQRPNFLSNAFIRRVDGQGNTIWFNYYGDYSNASALLDLKMVDDSTIIAATVEKVGNNDNGSHSILRTINLESGAVLDSFVSEPDPEIGYLRKVMPFPDGGGFLTYGVSVVEVTPFGSKLVQPTFARFSANFDLLWVKRFGKIYNLATGLGFLDIERTLDGHFIAAGRDVVELPDGNDGVAGTLVKFTEYGDSLWARYDQGPYPPNYIYAHHFSGVGILSSGNIVAAGTATLGMDDNIWLVKVTTDGCMDTILCEPITGIVEQARKEGVEMRVYPNPANQEISIELQNSNTDYFITIYNARGEKVASQLANSSSAKTVISVTRFSPGIYFLELRNKEGIVGREKVVVNR